MNIETFRIVCELNLPCRAKGIEEDLFVSNLENYHRWGKILQNTTYYFTSSKDSKYQARSLYIKEVTCPILDSIINTPLFKLVRGTYDCR